MIWDTNEKKRQELSEIYQVAHMYYDLNLLQSEIAEKLYLSRPKVSRLLTQARECGIVEIKVNPVIDRLNTLEERLCSIFGLKDALVINTCADQMESMDDFLTKFAAGYTSQLLQTGGVLGITNDPTVNTILNKISFPEQVPVEIVQLMGASTNSFSAQDTTLVLSKLTMQHPNITTRLLSVPLYVNDLYLKEVLLQENTVSSVFQRMTHCRIALTGILNLETKLNYHNAWQGLMGIHHIEELNDRRAVGSICAQYFDCNGIKIPSEWNAKVIAMNLNNFSRIETRIGVGQGLDKLDALFGALKGKLINVLVTDSNTATDLIDLTVKNKKNK